MHMVTHAGAPPSNQPSSLGSPRHFPFRQGKGQVSPHCAGPDDEEQLRLPLSQSGNAEAKPLLRSPGALDPAFVPRREPRPTERATS